MPFGDTDPAWPSQAAGARDPARGPHVETHLRHRAGKSLSQYLPGENHWRQVWVDDQGSWLAFTGGKRGDRFVLESEAVGSATARTMRMVFEDIREDHISWRWERDDGATWTPLLLIEYRRARAAK